MIKVTVRPASGDFTLEVKGHADPEVCAAVSAIVQTAALGCKAVAQMHPDKVTFKEVRPESGHAN